MSTASLHIAACSCSSPYRWWWCRKVLCFTCLTLPPSPVLLCWFLLAAVTLTSHIYSQETGVVVTHIEHRQSPAARPQYAAIKAALPDTSKDRHALHVFLLHLRTFTVTLHQRLYVFILLCASIYGGGSKSFPSVTSDYLSGFLEYEGCS